MDPKRFAMIPANSFARNVSGGALFSGGKISGKTRNVAGDFSETTQGL
jgi:hypothetical protein